VNDSCTKREKNRCIEETELRFPNPDLPTPRSEDQGVAKDKTLRMAPGSGDWFNVLLLDSADDTRPEDPTAKPLSRGAAPHSTTYPWLGDARHRFPG